MLSCYHEYSGPVKEKQQDVLGWCVGVNERLYGGKARVQ